MRIQREYSQVIVSKKGERWLDSQHPWLYESDILEINGPVANGDIVDVCGPKGKYLGTGFYSALSKIRVRIFCWDASATIDEAFWQRKVEYAWNYRKTIRNSDLNAVRVIFGESDQFPVLTVDKFNDVLVVQCLSYGMEQMKDLVYPLIRETLEKDGQSIRGIYERNDVAIRKLEGLKEQTGWYGQDGGLTETVIEENDVKYYVDFANGQKTGFFLDQQANRALTARLAHGKRVLDCFTHTGSFALNCAQKGAEKVTAVDISETAIQQARRNAELNGLTDRMEFVTADVFEYLKDVRKGTYDLIILDPPAFTKNRKTVNNAYNGYLEINQLAMKALGRGGYLATCSCSHFMSHEMFEKMLREASFKTGLNLKQISVSQQGSDHPIMWNVPETDYLKFYLFQLI